MARRFSIGSAWVELRADATGLREEIRTKVLAASRGITADVHVNIQADDHSLTLLKRKLAAVNDKSVRVRVRVDNDAGSQLDNLMRRVDRFTQRFSQSTRLLNFSGLNMAPIIALGAAAAAASPMLLSLASSMGAASAASMAAIPAFLGLGLAFAGLKGAFSPVKDAMKEYGSIQDQVRKGTISAAEGQAKMNAILAQLRPSVRGLVVELMFWKDQVLPGLTARIQDNLFPAITHLIQGLQGSVPIIDRFFQRFSIGIARAVNDLDSFTRSNLFAQQLQVMLDGAAHAFGRFAEAGVSAFRAIFSIGEAATPILIRFADWVAEVARRFQMWIEAKRVTGELAAFFKMAGDEASKWGQILGNFLMGILNILAAALPAGREMSSSLLLISQRFRAWTETNTEGLTRFFFFIKNMDWGSILRGVVAIGAMVLALKALAGVAALVNGAMSLLALGPVGMVIAAFVALAGAIAFLWAKSELFREAISTLISFALPGFHSMMQLIADALERNKEPLSNITHLMEIMANVIFNFLLPAFGQWIGLMIQVAGYMITGFIEAISAVIRFIELLIGWTMNLGGVWSAVWHGIAVVFAITWGAISSFWVSTWNNLRTWFGGRLADLAQVWSNTWTAIANFFAMIWNNITAFWVRTWDNLRSWFGGRLADLSFIWNFTWTAISNFFGFIWANIAGFWVRTWDNLRSWFGGRLADLQNAWNVTWTAIAQFFGFIWGVMAQTVGRLFEQIRNFIFGRLDMIRSRFQSIWTAIGNIMQAAWDRAKRIAAAGWNGIAGIINAAIGALNAVTSKFGFHIPADWRVPTIKLAQGGEVSGRVNGFSPHATADNIPAVLTAGEHVIRRDSVTKLDSRYPGLLDYVNKTGELPNMGATHGVKLANLKQFLQVTKQGNTDVRSIGAVSMPNMSFPIHAGAKGGLKMSLHRGNESVNIINKSVPGSPGWHPVGQDGPEIRNFRGGELVSPAAPVTLHKHNHFEPGSIVINASNVKEVKDMIQIFDKLSLTSKAGIRQTG